MPDYDLLAASMRHLVSAASKVPPRERKALIEQAISQADGDESLEAQKYRAEHLGLLATASAQMFERRDASIEDTALIEETTRNFGSAIEQLKSLGMHQDSAGMCINQGNFLQILYDLGALWTVNDAHSAYEKAQDLAKVLADTGLVADVYMNQANLWYSELKNGSRANIDVALTAFDEAISIYEHLNLSVRLAKCYCNKANYLNELGEIGFPGRNMEALHLTEQAVRIFEIENEDYERARAEANLANDYGVVAVETRDPIYIEKALALFENALHLKYSLGDQDGFARSLQQKAIFLASLRGSGLLKNKDDILGSFSEALRIRTLQKDDAQIANLRYGIAEQILADKSRSREDLNFAIDNIRKAKKLEYRLGNARAAAQSEHAHALLLLERNSFFDLSKARRHLRKALKLIDPETDVLMFLDITSTQVKTHNLANEHQEAVRSSYRALDAIYERMVLLPTPDSRSELLSRLKTFPYLACEKLSLHISITWMGRDP